ncbi:archaellin/type IV pilin N-terminal domain-containing protein [Halorubrum sp. AD140]|uniref:archaellin/type IV pilin N-terminal domain-containing protein n=1 Tax=Halorubrum sp. AD140 TaxID=3050073 RepID=UPI002ACCF9EF|nr:archaellin/type IV pilin N-terminal domain-containing protein [Halorubrum sp. AD140]MDZ5811064.1 archaellin/type IV pilin N-terminal domain-containing protein [Halorubrum sp. AD140]
MFEFINDDERGQVGIGTLIVFIAMVLVAAIAAGVLINTAGFLQSQAESTGEESTDLVSERIDVTSSVGIVSDAEEGNLSEMRVGVAGSAGSDQIDLSEATIEAVGPDGQENLVFSGPPEGDDATNISDNEFAVKQDGDYVDSDSAILDGDKQLTIVLNPEAPPFGDENEEAFGEGDSSSLEIVSPSSATTSVELQSPDLYEEDDEAVRL